MQKKKVIKVIKNEWYIKILKGLNFKTGDIMEYIPEDK